ncbi:MAG TPA: SGNH/GDSL hydrolase family protein [Pyrinomonadaceae bacterium]|nr:SGNH/GDSL hydrolase family protein [Pyrinomonadaceae bacterium]
MSLNKWQAKFILGGAAVLPISPFLYIQGRITRWKVGLLPEASDPAGTAGEGGESVTLLVLGESTVAGLGARTHELALGGQFAKGLSERIGKAVNWTVVGRNGVTARRTIDELLPLVPKEKFNYVLLGIGGNDVMKLSSPKKWRRDMLDLIGLVREANPEAVIFISNCPMIVHSPIMPQPIKGILWSLSKMHNANILEFTSGMDRLYYYPQPVDVDFDGFWADGIHPSEKGYRDWAAAMLKHFDKHHKW